jgi:ferrochelatase
MVVVPVAFVSEHSETLVELDMDYRALAEKHGCPGYFRVPALGVQPQFIGMLKQAVLQACEHSICSAAGKRLCPAERVSCPCT